MTELKYWLWLSLTLGQNSRKITSLLEQFETPLSVYKAKETDFYGIENISRKDAKRLSDKNMQKTEEVMTACRKNGIRIMTFDSPYYPKRLSYIFDPPYVLYVKSRERIDLNNTLPITMIGTRKMTPYGRAAALKLGEDLARAGVVVVSGMARGIDGCCHTGALLGGGKTVAVLACGLDIVYPPEHDELMRSIIENGMVLSEYPPSTPPLPGHFPIRNRIISGLSAGTVVVESPASGGSLITANLALEQGRDVFAVPGNINDPYSNGANELIRQGAHLVSSALDIIAEYQDEYIHIFEKAAQDEHSIPVVNSDTKNVVSAESPAALVPAIAPAITDDIYRSLPKEEQQILDSLSMTPTHVDAIAEKTGFRPDTLNATLTMLEMKGLVRQLAGRHYLLNL